MGDRDLTLDRVVDKDLILDKVVVKVATTPGSLRTFLTLFPTLQ